ncbi:MAG: MBL fold metallo-hydrolase [Promethearchaeota archaeon]
MRITIVFDNDLWTEGLRASWGFSCLVEAYGKKILFDTGSNGTMLLENLKKLNIDLIAIDLIFISHAHGDHTGGLRDILRMHQVPVYVPDSYSIHMKGIEIVKVKGILKISENIFSTGELKGIEQSLMINTEKGIVVIVGCSHPGVNAILNVVSQFGNIMALIGGLHGFNRFDLIKELQYICPAHCTKHKLKIKALYPLKYIKGGVGRVITL